MDKVKSTKLGEVVELEVFDLAFGGRGVAKLDGMVVLVHNAVPGDVIKAKILKRKRSFAEAEVLEIIKESSKRTQPRCSHFGFCGGCLLQNLKYEYQMEYKTKQVKDSLVHIGGFKEIKINPILGSDKLYFYRNKMEFSFDKNEKEELILGLHPRGRYDQVFDLKECFLQSELSNKIVSWIRGFFREKKTSVYDLKEHQGFLRYLAIKEAKSTFEVMVNLISNKGNFPFQEEFAKGLVEKLPQITSVMRNINSRLATIAVGEEEVFLAGKDHITEKVGDFLFDLSANSFFQTNSYQVEKLYTVVKDFADLKTDDNVLDLYCGIGTISIFLAHQAKKVIGVESLSQSVEDAQRNAQKNKVSNCEFVCGEAKKVLSELITRSEKFDVVVVDPPRAGLHPDVVAYLGDIKIEKLIYVSCNPATLARDLKLFCEGGYKIDQVQPVDMFPHTPHIETVVKLIL
ncbi:MAG: 23S rRNA (uracil(1939)-C(5))-methyltransferase RlmD [Promethearchaeota archaeon]